MPGCAIKWCGNNNLNCSYEKNNITFHRFPTDPDTKKKWIELTRRGDNWWPSKHSTVCSRHFTDECFISTKSRRRLVGTALPTLDLPVLANLSLSSGTRDENGDSFNKTKPLLVATQFGSSQAEIAQPSTAKDDRGDLSRTIPESLTRSSHSNFSPQCNPLGRKRISSPDIEQMLNSPSCTPRKKKLCRRIVVLDERMSKKNKKIKRLQSQKSYLKKKVAFLTSIIKDLESKELINAENAAILSRIGVAQKELIQRQMKKTKSGHIIRNKYSSQLKTFALTLNFYSTKAYKYVRKTFNTCLPSLRTLAKWYQSVEGRPGFTKESFNALKFKTEQLKNKIYATLVIDEMKIKNKVEYSPRSGRAFGFVDYGTGLNTDCNDECSDALVFLVVPINARFKVPIAFFLIHSITGDKKAMLVIQALRLCHEVNVDIVALTFDGCPANFSMARALGGNLEHKNLKTSFKHPVSNNEVILWPDPCHTIKLIRNSFHHYKQLIDSENRVIKWEHIEKLKNLQEQENFHIANKLRQQHIDFKSNIMKVKLATQLFSRSVAEALRFCKEAKLGDFADVDGTVNMLLLLNDAFDILDSKVHGYGFKKAISEENHSEIFSKLDVVKDFLLSVRTTEDNVTKKLVDSRRFVGYIGICATIDSVKVLYNTLINNSNCPITYIPLHKLSQDHLELFFCNIRCHGGSCDNPTPRQFETIYKKILIHTELMDISSGNCMPLEQIAILNCSSAITRINMTTSYKTEEDYVDVNTVNIDQELDSIESVLLSQFSEHVIEYIAGFVASALIERLKCATCIKALVSLTVKPRSVTFFRDKGGLIYPSADVIKLCRRCEMIIKKFFIDMDSNKIIKRNCRTDFFVNKTLATFAGEFFFENFTFHQYETTENNHLIDLAKCVLTKYTDTRLSYLLKSNAKKNVVRRVYRKLIHFKNQ